MKASGRLNKAAVRHGENKLNGTMSPPPKSITEKLFDGEEDYDKYGTLKSGRHPDKKTYNKVAAGVLATVAGWSYSDVETFKDMIADETSGVGIDDGDFIEISVKNDPMLVVATAQVIRSQDKKVAIVCFRGTEMVNAVNWLTDAQTRTSDYNGMKVHDGFLTNFNAVWKGSKGILEHLRSPAMLSEGYDYETGDVSENNEQDRL